MTDVMLQLPTGVLRGMRSDRVDTFLGIPFAEPPIGPLRFHPPQPLTPWNGIRDALEHGPAAMQQPTVLESGRGFTAGCSEDCLYLNVWAPTPAIRHADHLPVMVWIHGGSFVNGSGSLAWYDGAKLAARGDVVVVTINYRLGAFGYLDLSEIGGAAYQSSGNSGLLDQVAALEWIRDNIEIFGGDADRVCLVGESAGAMGIGALLAARPAKGLFNRAIMQSGAPVGTVRSAATRMADEVFSILDLPRTAEGLSRLLEIPAEAILSASDDISLRQQMGAFAGIEGGFAWLPTVDGSTLLEHPNAAIAAGASSDIPVMVGTTMDEMRIIRVLIPGMPAITEEELTARVRDKHGARAEEVLGWYKNTYSGADADDLWWAVMGDETFGIPTAVFIDERLRQAAPTWSYSFEWSSPVLDGLYGSAHTMEIPYVFGNFAAPGVEEFLGPISPEMQDLATVIQDAWVHFVTHGDPATDALPDWKPCSSDPSVTMCFDAESRVGPDRRRAIPITDGVQGG